MNVLCLSSFVCVIFITRTFIILFFINVYVIKLNFVFRFPLVMKVKRNLMQQKHVPKEYRRVVHYLGHLVRLRSLRRKYDCQTNVQLSCINERASVSSECLINWHELRSFLFPDESEINLNMRMVNKLNASNNVVAW